MRMLLWLLLGVELGFCCWLFGFSVRRVETSGVAGLGTFEASGWSVLFCLVQVLFMRLLLLFRLAAGLPLPPPEGGGEKRGLPLARPEGG